MFYILAILTQSFFFAIIIILKNEKRPEYITEYGDNVIELLTIISHRTDNITGPY